MHLPTGDLSDVEHTGIFRTRHLNEQEDLCILPTDDLSDLDRM